MSLGTWGRSFSEWDTQLRAERRICARLDSILITIVQHLPQDCGSKTPASGYEGVWAKVNIRRPCSWGGVRTGTTIRGISPYWWDGLIYLS